MQALLKNLLANEEQYEINIKEIGEEYSSKFQERVVEEGTHNEIWDIRAPRIWSDEKNNRRENYYLMVKELKQIDDLVEFASQAKTKQIIKYDKKFQEDVKKDGYILGGCRHIGKGTGISFPAHIWKFIKDYAIIDIRIPMKLERRFTYGRKYKAVDWDGQGSYWFICEGRTPGGKVKFTRRPFGDDRKANFTLDLVNNTCGMYPLGNVLHNIGKCPSDRTWLGFIKHDLFRDFGEWERKLFPKKDGCRYYKDQLPVVVRSMINNIMDMGRDRREYYTGRNELNIFNFGEQTPDVLRSLAKEDKIVTNDEIEELKTNTGNRNQYTGLLSKTSWLDYDKTLAFFRNQLEAYIQMWLAPYKLFHLKFDGKKLEKEILDLSEDIFKVSYWGSLENINCSPSYSSQLGSKKSKLNLLFCKLMDMRKSYNFRKTRYFKNQTIESIKIPSIGTQSYGFCGGKSIKSWTGESV